MWFGTYFKEKSSNLFCGREPVKFTLVYTDEMEAFRANIIIPNLHIVLYSMFFVYLSSTHSIEMHFFFYYMNKQSKSYLDAYFGQNN